LGLPVHSAGLYLSVGVGQQHRLKRFFVPLAAGNEMMQPVVPDIVIARPDWLYALAIPRGQSDPQYKLGTSASTSCAATPLQTVSATYPVRHANPYPSPAFRKLAPYGAAGVRQHNHRNPCGGIPGTKPST